MKPTERDRERIPSRPRRGRIFDPFRVGTSFSTSPFRRFHLRLMNFIPCGEKGPTRSGIRPPTIPGLSFAAGAECPQEVFLRGLRPHGARRRATVALEFRRPRAPAAAPALASGLLAVTRCHASLVLTPIGKGDTLMRWEIPRLCRGGSRCLTHPGVGISLIFTVSTRPLTPTPLPLFPLPGGEGRGAKG